MRLTSARALLASHHSAQKVEGHGGGAAMPQRRNGGGGGGGGIDAPLRRQLLALLGAGDGGKGDGRGGFRQGRSDGPGARGGGGGGRGGGGAAGADRRSRREGDWDCPTCGFGPNFAVRASCYKCGVARGGGGGGRSPGTRRGPTRGPIGAGGSTPMLSTFAAKGAAQREGNPTHRKPGSSLAADAMAQSDRLEPRPRQLQRAGGGAAGATSVATEEPKEHGGGWRTVGGTQRARWADQVPPCDTGDDDQDDDGYADEDVAWEDLEGDERQEEEDADVEGEPEPEQLRRLWEQEGKAVRILEQQGLPDNSPVLVAAREARDRSEEAWRRAKKPQPLATRMGWMQKKVDRAAKALEKARLDYESFEEEVDQRRQILQDRIKEAEQWYWHRDSQMEELHAEAGGLVSGGPSSAAAMRSSADSDVEQLRSAYAKEMQAFAESLEEGTEARNKANLLLAKLENVRPTTKGPEQFHIGGEQHERHGEEHGYALKGKARGANTCNRWNVDAGGRWNKAQGAKGAATGPRGRGDGAGAQAMVVEDELANRDAMATLAQPAATKAGDGTRVGGRGGAERGRGEAAGAASQSPMAVPREAVQGEVGQTSGKGRATGGVRPRDEEEGPCPKSHRGHDIPVDEVADACEGDAQRAERLRQEQAAAVAAAVEANATLGDDKSRQIAGQLYAHQVEMAKKRAEKVRVPVEVGGKQLIELSPEDFGEWVRKALEPAEAAARASQGHRS